MAKFIIYVQLKGSPKPVAIDGDDAREVNNEILVMEDGQVVARFNSDQVQGWWKQKP
jgi:hypothetical protein